MIFGILENGFQGEVAMSNAVKENCDDFWVCKLVSQIVITMSSYHIPKSLIEKVTKGSVGVDESKLPIHGCFLPVFVMFFS